VNDKRRETSTRENEGMRRRKRKNIVEEWSTKIIMATRKREENYKNVNQKEISYCRIMMVKEKEELY
jgi:hypothetical protein